jgi:DNA replication protein DnaC
MMDLSELARASMRIRQDALRPAAAAQAEERECPTHGRYAANGEFKANIGRTVWTRCPGCRDADKQAVKAEAEQRSAAARATSIERALKLANIPKRFTSRTFETFIAADAKQSTALTACRAYAEDFSDALRSGGSLVLSGAPGTGKSHLAASVMLQVMAGGCTVQYMTCMDMIRAIRGTWRKDSERTEDDVLRELGETLDLLVIDEVGMQYGTEGEQTVLFDVLDRRYRQMRPTILISNANREQFRTYVGDRVYDRLREVAKWVAFDWGSYRPTARAEAERGAA